MNEQTYFHVGIYVYDMNCPGAGQTIKIDLTSDVLKAVESCPRADALTGFFCEYKPSMPPA